MDELIIDGDDVELAIITGLYHQRILWNGFRELTVNVDRNRKVLHVGLTARHRSLDFTRCDLLSQRQRRRSACASTVVGDASTTMRNGTVVVVVGMAVDVTTTGRDVVTGVRTVVVGVNTLGRAVVLVDTLGRTVAVVLEVVVMTLGRTVVVVVLTVDVVMIRGRTVVVVVRRGRGIVETEVVTNTVVEVELVVVVVVVDVVVAGAPPLPEGAGTVTVMVGNVPEIEVCGFPARSATENEPAAASEATTAPPPAVAVDVTLRVHTVLDVCTIKEIAEMPERSKSTPEVVSSVVQSMSSSPVRVKEIDDVDEVVAGTPTVSVGAVESIVTVPVEAADTLLAESAA